MSNLMSSLSWQLPYKPKNYMVNQVLYTSKHDYVQELIGALMGSCYVNAHVLPMLR